MADKGCTVPCCKGAHCSAAQQLGAAMPVLTCMAAQGVWGRFRNWLTLLHSELFLAAVRQAAKDR